MHFDGLREKVAARLSEGDVYVVDAFAGRRSRPPHRRPRHLRESLARAVREDAVHRSDRRGARGDGAAGARPARSVGLGGPRRGRDPQRDVRLPASVAHGGRHRWDVLRGRDQEVDLHGDERPTPARGGAPDALLGEPRRRRQGCGLLRALRHRQDDALRRSRAAPDRRRRARLVGSRGVQHRGRVLREGHPALGRGRAADLRDDSRFRYGARERRHGRARRARSRRRLRRPRTHARRTSSSGSRTPSPRSAAATRARSCSSPPTPSGSSRRSRD